MSIKTCAMIGGGALIAYALGRLGGGTHFEAVVAEMCFLLFVLTCFVGDLVDYHHRVTVSNALFQVSQMSDADKTQMLEFFAANKSRIRTILG